LNWQIFRLLTLEDAVHIGCRSPKLEIEVPYDRPLTLLGSSPCKFESAFPQLASSCLDRAKHGVCHFELAMFTTVESGGVSGAFEFSRFGLAYRAANRFVRHSHSSQSSLAKVSPPPAASRSPEIGKTLATYSQRPFSAFMAIFCVQAGLSL
jgi:hypothetical protein